MSKNIYTWRTEKNYTTCHNHNLMAVVIPNLHFAQTSKLTDVTEYVALGNF